MIFSLFIVVLLRMDQGDADFDEERPLISQLEVEDCQDEERPLIAPGSPISVD